MKIITEPAVYLTGFQQLNQPELDRFLADHGVTWQSDSEVAAEALCETSGRICYMSFAKPRPGGNSAYLHHIREVGHGSVLEHAVYNLVFVGVSRSLTHELVRHRAGWAYSQLSQRYVDESVAEYVEPDIIAADPELHALWVETVERTHAAYVSLSEKLNAKLNNCDYHCAECFWRPSRFGCPVCGGDSRSKLSAMFLPPEADKTTIRKTARQAARSVLPNATETKIAVTVNCRAARHFIEQRASRHAEPEIRKLAYKVWRVLSDHSPNLFSDYRTVPLQDGTIELVTDYPKV